MKSINHFKTTTNQFLELYPASSFALCGIIFSLIPLKFALFLLPLLLSKILYKYILFGFIFSFHSLTLPIDLPNESALIRGTFIPKKTVNFPNFFKNQKGIFGTFKTTHQTYKLVLFTDNQTRLIEHPCELFLEVEKGETLPKTSFKIIKVFPQKFSLFLFRQKISKYLNHHFYSQEFEESSSLLYALFTGDLDHKLLKVKFSSFGLAHILALSGFHLNLLSWLCFSCLKPFTNEQIARFFSMFMLLIYFVYIGPSCSITRAFSMALCGFIHSFFSIKTKPLHTFCLSLIITTFICQKDLLEPSFSLTFLATLSLICFSAFWKKVILFIQNAKTHWENFVYSWLKFFSMQLFVFLFTLPACLYHFHQVQSISLFYNLFFPAIISCFMICGCFFAFIKVFANAFGHRLLEKAYFLFDYALKSIESPHLAKGVIIQSYLPCYLYIFTILCQILIVFELFKKNKVI